MLHWLIRERNDLQICFLSSNSFNFYFSLKKRTRKNVIETSLHWNVALRREKWLIFEFFFIIFGGKTKDCIFVVTEMHDCDFQEENNKVVAIIKWWFHEEKHSTKILMKNVKRLNKIGAFKGVGGISKHATTCWMLICLPFKSWSIFPISKAKLRSRHCSRWVFCLWSSPIVSRTLPTFAILCILTKKSWRERATTSKNSSKKPKICFKLPKVSCVQSFYDDWSHLLLIFKLMC